MKKMIVFSDLDGTLLDHNNYEWTPATDAINLLKKNNFPLIINSSKTSTEISLIRKDIGNTDPYICENGAVLHLNENMTESSSDTFYAMYFTKPYEYLRETLNALKCKYNYEMTGFGDIDLETLMNLTGLNKINASAAKSREATEPLKWNDTEESLNLFIKQLKDYELTLTKGGRFYHLMSPVSKGDSIDFVLNKYKEIEPDTEWITVGLGDSFNDIPMLELVDYPILIRNSHGKRPVTSHLKNLTESEQEGPSGWNSEILKMIKTTTG